MSNYWLDLDDIAKEPEWKKVPKGPCQERATAPFDFGGKEPYRGDISWPDKYCPTKQRKLRAKWTREAAEDLRAFHNLDCEQALTEILVREIAQEIDKEIIEILWLMK